MIPGLELTQAALDKTGPWAFGKQTNNELCPQMKAYNDVSDDVSAEIPHLSTIGASTAAWRLGSCG